MSFMPGFRYTRQTTAACEQGDVMFFVAAANADAKVTPGAATTGAFAGVAMRKAAADEYVTLQLGGLAEVKAGAAITNSGAAVACDAASRVRTAVSTNNIVGWSINPAAADGDTITILVAAQPALLQP